MITTTTTHCRTRDYRELEIRSLENTINNLNTNLSLLTTTVDHLLKRKLTFTAGDGIVITPTIPEDLTSDREWVFDVTISGGGDSIGNILTLDTVDILSTVERGQNKIAFVNDPIRGGLFQYFTSLIADNGVVFNAADGGFWLRDLTQNDSIFTSWYGIDITNTTDVTALINAASTAARTYGKKLYIPEGQYKIDGTVNLYTDVDMTGTFRFSNASSKVSILPSLSFITLSLNETTALVGLTKGSTNVSILNQKGATVLFRSSSEVLINRYDDGPVTPYFKQQLICLTDDFGNFNSPLQEDYTDLTVLTARVYPAEKEITINGLNVVVDTIFPLQQPVSCNRSFITFNNFKLINKDDPNKGYIGLGVSSSSNVTFNTPRISGFNDYNAHTGGRLGYGLLLTSVYRVYINDAIIDDCKHTIMVSFGTDVYVNRGVLTGIDHTAIGSNNLQVLDAHWVYGWYINDVTIYSRFGCVSGISAAGGNIYVTNSRIYNAWSICGMSATTPEIRGTWLAEDNYIEFSLGASYMYFLGLFSSGQPYGTTFTRTIDMPKYVSIKNNKFINPNPAKQFFLYRGMTTVMNKNVTELFELYNNIAISGRNITSIFNSTLHVIREEHKCSVPSVVIDVKDQPIFSQDYNNIAATLRISSRFMSTMTTPYTYDVSLINCGSISTEVDIDACSRFYVRNCDIVSTNGANSNLSGEVKVRSFFYEINNSSIGKNLPAGATYVALNATCNPWKLIGSTIYSTLKIRGTVDGALGETQFTNFNNGLVISKSNHVVKDSQLASDGVTIIRPSFKTDNWVNRSYYEPTNDNDLYNFTTSLPDSSTILDGKWQIGRFNDGSLGVFANDGGNIVDLSSTDYLGLTSNNNITPKRKNRFYIINNASSATTQTIKSSSYVTAGFLIGFRHNSGFPCTIVADSDVTIGGTYSLYPGEELILISISPNNWRPYVYIKNTLTQKTVVNANVGIVSTDSNISFITTLTNPRTATLPDPTSAQPYKYYTIKDETGLAGTYNINVVSAGTSITIDGLSTFVINRNYGKATFYTNGVQWFTVVADSGNLSSTNYVMGEIPTGTVDGTNTSFTLANTPVTGKEVVYLNGIRQKRTVDYNISGAVITFVTAPSSTPAIDEIIADYIK